MNFNTKDVYAVTGYKFGDVAWHLAARKIDGDKVSDTVTILLPAFYLTLSGPIPEAITKQIEEIMDNGGDETQFEGGPYGTKGFDLWRKQWGNRTIRKDAKNFARFTAEKAAGGGGQSGGKRKTRRAGYRKRVTRRR